MMQAKLRQVRCVVAASAVLLAASCGSTSNDGSPDSSATSSETSEAAADSVVAPIASTTTTDGTSTTSTTEPNIDPLSSDQGPLLFFGAVPPKPDSVDYRIPFGATDYFELFEPDAPWADALEHVSMFRLHAFQMRHYLSDDHLRLIIDWLDEHQIPLLFETEPLQPVDPEECDHSESFEGPYDLEMAERFKNLGGTIDVVAIEQPFTYAHKLEGPRVCHYTLERIVSEVTDYMTEMRSMFPGVPMGSIEGLVRSPVTTPEDMALWLDSYEEFAGEPLEFLHIDVDWSVPGWTDILLGIEQVADARGVPFGVLYNGGLETTSERWLQKAAEHVAEFETNAGGTPDHATLTSWVDQPDRVLPDDDLGAFTSLINRYSGIRTVLESLEFTPASDGSPAQMRGRLVDANGNGLAGQTVEASIVEDNPTAVTAILTGMVPVDATDASILTRANVEGAVTGATSFRLYDVQYQEGGGPNLVPNGDHSQGGRFWYIDGDPIGDAAIVPSDADLAVGSGNMLSVVAEPDQIVFVNGEAFPVTPGAEFEFRATFAFDPSAEGVGTVSLAFLNPDTRTTIRMQPVAQPVAPTVTDNTGAFTLDLPELQGGGTVELRAPGDLETWPALGSVRIGG